MSDYNGWRNRSTWSVALYIGNDEGLYSIFKRMKWDAIKDQWEQWFDQIVEAPMELSRDMRMCIMDIGDLSDVDWHAIERSCDPEDEGDSDE